jgi:hypothetical protein
MDRTTFIANIILSMREFQKEHNITSQCVTNAQYLYDIIKTNTSNDVKTKAVFVFSNDNMETAFFVGGHLVILLDDDTVIDPSYDIFCRTNNRYFDNVKDFMNIFDDKTALSTRIDIKKLLHDHITFMKLAERINNGEFIITEKKFYNDQADYIEKLYSKKHLKTQNA